MEDLIKRVLEENGLTKIKLITLIDLGSEVDDDGDVFPITANTIKIDENDNVVIYDDREEDENGDVDNIVFVNALDKELQHVVYWNLEYTLNFNK